MMCIGKECGFKRGFPDLDSTRMEVALAKSQGSIEVGRRELAGKGVS